MDDYDSPWKEALDLYFEAFVAFCFPAMHREIDWLRPYVTLDKELQKVTPDAEQGRRFVDKLVQVWRIDGQEEWLRSTSKCKCRRNRSLPGGCSSIIAGWWNAMINRW